MPHRNNVVSQKSVKAKVCWTAGEDGGRESIPLEGAYCTVARFELAWDQYPREAWSLVLQMLSSLDESRCLTAEVRFLNPDGPMHLLQSGSRFELYEGYRRVAKGRVL